MNPDTDRYYKALLSRDARFDGRFFTGVKTTGVYCRPICPAITPKRENIEFYACAAAAEAAGYRPCLRCRPEAAPGTPAWAGTSATVSRAFRLIAEGFLDDHSVDELAERLGVGERHLRRLFVEHMGASPLAVAQCRRVQLAKQLVNDTTLPLTEVAFASGFSSVRRFNAALRTTFGRPPRELRRNGAARKGSNNGTHASLRLSYRPPLDVDAVMTFLGMRAIPGVEEVEGRVYRRTVILNDESGVIEISPVPGKAQLNLRVPLQLAGALPVVVARTKQLFDLNADPAEIARQLRRDPALAGMVKVRPGLRLVGAWEPFEIAVRAVLGQQVSVVAARTMAGRLTARYGERLGDAATDTLTHCFPRAEKLVNARLETIGLTKQRAAALKSLARAALERDVFAQPYADVDELVRSLCTLPGIGPWTAHYIAMRAFGEPDAFPAGDLGLRRALGTSTRPMAEAKLLQRAERWRPWRAYATMHIWCSGAAEPRTTKEKNRARR